MPCVDTEFGILIISFSGRQC